MRALLRRALPVLVVAGVLLVPAVASAHPLGNFTVNTSAGIVLSPGDVRDRLRRRPGRDPDGPGAPGARRRRRRHVSARRALGVGARDAPRRCRRRLTLAVDGEPVALDGRVGERRAPRRARAASTSFGSTRRSSAPIGDAGAIAFEDANYDGRVGWHEVTATGVDGRRRSSTRDVPATSLTDRLRTYPEDLLVEPARRARGVASRSARRRRALGRPAIATRRPSGRPAVAGGAFADLVDRTGPFMLARAAARVRLRRAARARAGARQDADGGVPRRCGRAARARRSPSAAPSPSCTRPRCSRSGSSC